MSAYYTEINRCSVVIVLRAVIDAKGNQCEAAKTLDIHRNTMQRILKRAGWTSERLKQLAEERNSELKSAAAVRRAVEGMRKPIQHQVGYYEQMISGQDSQRWKEA